MDVKKIEQKTYKLLENYLSSLGYELILVEFLKESKGWILRLYIDKEEGSISLDDCVNVSELIDPLLDVEDYIKTSYNLEVSSPGLNRPLRKVNHFKKVIGSKIKVVLIEPLENNRKNFKGELLDVNDKFITLKINNENITLAFNNIKKANLIYQF